VAGSDTAAELPLTAAVDYLKEQLAGAIETRVLVIAGSGLSGFLKAVEVSADVEYDTIPGVGESTVEGHAGKLVYGHAGEAKSPVLVMAGRRHIYEGIPAAQAAFLPMAVFQAFPQVQTLIVTNAAGGLNPFFKPGDFMVISDQVNWMFRNPLIGKNREEIGPRFPDMCNVYTPELRQLAHNVALEQGIALHEGVYLAGTGPTYETWAEANMMKNVCGADAVGMSTVPEVIAAAHAGRRVLGISLISNLQSVPAVTSHQEVIDAARHAEKPFMKLMNGILEQLNAGA